MVHKNRVWSVAPVATAEELAEKLTQHTWCCCNGFELEGHLWLNDATGADGAQEYAVVRKPTDADPYYRQVESITASWCTTPEMLRYIDEVQNGMSSAASTRGPVVVVRSLAELSAALGVKDVTSGSIVHPAFQTPLQHGRCLHCA